MKLLKCLFVLVASPNLCWAGNRVEQKVGSSQINLKACVRIEDSLYGMFPCDGGSATRVFGWLFAAQKAGVVVKYSGCKKLNSGYGGIEVDFTDDAAAKLGAATVKYLRTQTEPTNLGFYVCEPSR